MTKESVSVGWQTAFIFIPYVWIYAFFRIEKLRMGLILVLISTGINIPIQMILPFPYGLAVSYIIIIVIPVRFIRKWSREWNTKCESST